MFATFDTSRVGHDKLWSNSGSAANPLSEDKPSKSSRKRDAHARQALGEELTRQSSAVLDRLPLEPTLRQAVDEYARLTKRLAQKRQLQFIGRLMREADVDAIAAGLEALRGGSLAQKRRERCVERWRTRLLEQGDPALAELLDAHPDTDRQRIRALIRQCLKKPEDQRAARALARFLAELIT